jgi:hypothetical protein
MPNVLNFKGIVEDYARCRYAFPGVPWMLIFIDLLREYGIESVYALKANE